ncbi:hypothetical protein DPMN_152641 [Dreissena polymorpha]|uniref:Secreted protein n=1 Tax=Dreissena polymorpha TaxID=45954 RepID=A0A9D4FND5_DREPO|nr:hypothetical protein DPMN_152641 [Dreissena polymorpha]
MTSFKAVSYTVVCVWAIQVTCSNVENAENPVGDLRACMHGTYGPRYRFEVLPSGGWDNLRNKETGMIVKLNFLNAEPQKTGGFCCQMVFLRCL